MDNTLIELSARGLALVPVAMALVEVGKKYIDTRWAPIMGLVIGVFLSFTVGGATFLGSAVLGGIVIGLLAGGVWSNVKTTAGY